MKPLIVTIAVFLSTISYGQTISDYKYVESIASSVINDGHILVKPFNYKKTGFVLKNYWFRELEKFDYYSFSKGDTLLGIFFTINNKEQKPYDLMSNGDGFLVVPPFVSFEIQEELNPFYSDDKIKYGVYQSQLYPDIISPFIGQIKTCRSGIWPLSTSFGRASKKGVILMEVFFVNSSEYLEAGGNEIADISFIPNYLSPKGELFESTLVLEDLLTSKDEILKKLNSIKDKTYIDVDNKADRKVLQIIF